MKLIVDIVHNPELREQMRSGDVIVKINGGSANKYLQKVAEYCQRPVNSFLYNM